MSQEYRDGIVKQISQMSEGAKTRIRVQRQDARTALKKSDANKEDEKRAEKEVLYSTSTRI